MARKRPKAPDLSRLLLLVGIVVVAGATVAFVDLGLRRNAALAEYLQAQSRLVQLQQQRQQLERELEKGEQGEDIVPKAFLYFGLVPEGMSAAVLQPEALPEEGVGSADPAEHDGFAALQELWDGVLASLTNGGKPVQ